MENEKTPLQKTSGKYCNNKLTNKKIKFETIIITNTSVTKKKLKDNSNNLHQILNNMMPTNLKHYYKDGLRFLEPYWSIFGSFVKGRWVGKEINEVFSTEFLSHNKYYSKAAIRLGRVFINGKQMINPHYRFHSSDRVLHLGHRHEHPILEYPKIEILTNTDDWFVINKPPSLPVHACGQYRVHSVLGLLKSSYNIENLKVCHRLDRTTSGVLIFARNQQTDAMFKKLMRENKLSKEYVCKVRGIFPKELSCNASIGTLSVTMGIQCVKEDGKKAFSKFWRISTDNIENTSLILCKIETGRTHQIRVHLQYLGYPIINDYFYDDEVWGVERGKNANYGKNLDELKELVQARHKLSMWFETENLEYEKRLQKIAADEMQVPEKIDLKNLKLDELPTYDSICLGCNVQKKIPSKNHFQLMLHCWKYKGPDWEFTAPLPSWASTLHQDHITQNLCVSTL